MAKVSNCCKDSMIDWENCWAVERSVDKMSGAWIFRGTRITVAALFVNIADGATIDDFVEWFPGVGRRQIESVLRHAGASLQNTF